MSNKTSDRRLNSQQIDEPDKGYNYYFSQNRFLNYILGGGSDPDSWAFPSWNEYRHKPTRPHNPKTRTSLHVYISYYSTHYAINEISNWSTHYRHSWIAVTSRIAVTG